MTPGERPPAKRRALLVANGTYADSRLRRLRAPTGDVEALEAVLSDPDIGGFDVDCVVDQGTPDVKRTIEEFFAGGGLNDLLVLYISGHGVMSEDGRLYFASSSTQLDFLDATAIDDSFIARQMRRPRTRTRSIVLILDCCHSGAFERGHARKGSLSVGIGQRFIADEPPDEPRPLIDGRGHVVLTASSELEYAFEDMSLDEFHPSEPGSLFTRFLVEGLRTGDADLDEDGLVAVDELYDYVFGRIREHSHHQTPGMISTTRGRLFIARNPNPARRPPPRGRELQRWLHDGVVRGVVYSADATRLGTCSDDRTARVWDAGTGRELLRLVHPLRHRPSRELFAVDFSPDCDCLATAGRDRTARVWALGDGSELLRIIHGNWVRAVSFSPDGEFVASAGDDRSARVWSLSERRELITVTEGKSLNAVAFSPDSARLATAGDDRSACVWDLDDDRRLKRVTHDGAVWDVAFSPDGTLLATASEDRSARVWDLADRRPPVVLNHDAAVWSVAFSPDGSKLATAGGDVFVRVWDLSDRREVLKLAHDDVVMQVTFSPDGGQLATASADLTARVWEL